MTAKEAKNFLREFLGDKPNFREECPGYVEEVYRQMDMLAEAIDLAISALEGKDTDVPSTDLISRQAAIDAADRADYTGLAIEDVKKVTDEVVKEVKKLPSVQPVITCDGCRFVSTYDTDFPCCSRVRRERDYYEPER